MPSSTHAWSRTRIRGCAEPALFTIRLLRLCCSSSGAGPRSFGTCWSAASGDARSRCSVAELRVFTTAPSQVGCETATKTGMVMVFGEITTSAKVDYEAIVRKTCRDIGFTSAEVGLDADKCKVPFKSSLQACRP